MREKIIRRRLQPVDIELTSLVDILFILLIFILLTFQFRSKKNLDANVLSIQIPQGKSDKLRVAKQTIGIYILWDEASQAAQIRLGKKTVVWPDYTSFMNDFSQEKKRLKVSQPAISKELPKDLLKEVQVEIIADGRVPSSQLLRIFSYLQYAGIKESSIVMRNEKKH